MKERCFEPGELGTIPALDAGDSRRVHLEECPRCRASLIAYRKFMEPDAPPEGSRPEEADRRLAAALDAEFSRAGRPAAVDAVGAKRAPGGESGPVGRSGPSRPRRSVLERFFGARGLRPVWAAAAALAIVGVFYVVRVAEMPGTGRLVLRGSTGGARGAPALMPARPAPGAVELRWASTPTADAYQVALYASDLTEIARLGPFADTSAVLHAAERPRGIEPGTEVLWRVFALRQGDPIATSPVGRLRLP